MSDFTATIRDHLKNAREAQVGFLAALVQEPSDNPPGDCQAHAERAAALLEGLGFAVERHRVPAATVKKAGMIAATNLVVRKKFGEGPVIALNAHGDVVPPGTGWTKDPYGAEIVDGWMYGRGVAVSKSDFATYAYALLALQAAAVAGATLKGTVELHLTYDEEAGGEIGPRRDARQHVGASRLAHLRARAGRLTIGSNSARRFPQRMPAGSATVPVFVEPSSKSTIVRSMAGSRSRKSASSGVISGVPSHGGPSESNSTAIMLKRATMKFFGPAASKLSMMPPRTPPITALMSITVATPTTMPMMVSHRSRESGSMSVFPPRPEIGHRCHPGLAPDVPPVLFPDVVIDQIIRLLP